MATQQANHRLIAEWLARAHPVPEQARAEWSAHGVALLPLGERFAAVRVAADVLHAAVGCEEHGDVAAVLAELLPGAVIHDHRTTGATYYALIQAQAGLVWADDPLAPCLGKGTYLGVPRVDRREPPGTYWVMPPRHDGDLCHPGTVRSLIATGRRNLALHATA
ncbi:hypothetical protein [Streptomyces avermitilis]|uniref:hypothetical protein n=1 Tax=Streptomyces avermitilis TaxID=33903 RepID=UPI003713677E